MRGIYKKIENWIWIILLIGALIYFQWLIGSLHSENEKLRESQSRFDQEIEEKYQKSKQLQIEIQARLHDITQDLLEFLKTTQSFDPESY